MSKATGRKIKVDPTIIYPESDGKPMAENTKQYQYIVMLHTGIDSHFANQPDVFVAADLLWYAVEGWPSIRVAPDVMVVFGRPKGHRGSYQQWMENGVAPQVAIEILSPGNTKAEMDDKLAFYEEHGVEEYIEYDPDRGKLQVWQRKGRKLMPVVFGKEWNSPLLQIRLRLESDGELSAFHPDGRQFLTAVEIDQLAQREHARAERLAAKLRELGVDPETLN
ncbi:MAG: Uma2 family endonuclease [Acidobacteriota bacterium]|nr:Uma2 family endonuclease [Acidobacteriota bacterium]